MAKIMIVDDDKGSVKLTESLLQKAGYQTCVAVDGQRAMDLIVQEQPDLILMDIMMPEMDGVKAVEELQKNKLTQNIPIILISAQKEEINLMKGLLFGPVGYHEKPIDSRRLLHQIEQQLKKSRLGEKE